MTHRESTGVVFESTGEQWGTYPASFFGTCGNLSRSVPFRLGVRVDEGGFVYTSFFVSKTGPQRSQYVPCPLSTHRGFPKEVVATSWGSEDLRGRGDYGTGGRVRSITVPVPPQTQLKRYG